MSNELVKKADAEFWEVSIIGMFRAMTRDQAHFFVRSLAIKLQEMGVDEVGWDFRRTGGGGVIDHDEAKLKLLEDTWRPEWGTPPWVQEAVEVIAEPFPDDPTHEEVVARLAASRKALGGGDGETEG